MNDQEKIEEIKKIHQEYEDNLAVLKLEQNNLLDEYVGELERMKMEELRNKLQI